MSICNLNWRWLACLGLMFSATFSSHAQGASMTSGGRFIRGSSPSTNLTYDSFVIPLDGQPGTTNAPSLATTLNALGGRTALYHYNAASAGSQSLTANRIAYTNAIAAFGGKYAGRPLYMNQAYRFGAYAGNPDFTIQTRTNAFIITAVDRTSGAFVGGIEYTVPIPSVTNEWIAFLTNGATKTFTTLGLTTTFSFVSDLSWGTHDPGGLTLTHVADSTTGNYEYTVWVQGLVDTGFGMTTVAGNGIYWTPLYTMDFDPLPPWQATFVSEPQFQGQPLPSTYAGKSLAELLAVQAQVTNTVASAATNWLDLDNSPELRQSPVLDQFVASMGSNALSLASYVQNQIELTDAVAYNNNTNLLPDASVNLGGVNRSALGTFMEGRGSPVEQCALLVYLLRKSGVPAAYIYGPNDGIQMLDTSLSKLLRMQIKGAVNNLGQLDTTNTLIGVNYPWVAAYVNGQWMHLFPWLKDTQVTEGLNLYDYMPDGYKNGYEWIRHYLAADTNIFSLSAETDVPSVLFEKFIQNALLTTAPGVSLDDIGTTCVDRQVQYSRWSDFPTPFMVTNGVVNTVHDLTSITNIFPTYTNIWDTISLQVFSVAAPSKSIFTGDLRLADLHNRKFLVRHEATNANYNLILSLAPYRPTNTNTFGFTNDVALLNHEQEQMTLATTDDNLTLKFIRKRHRVVPGAVTNSENSYLGVGEELQTTTTSPLRLGDLAAICLNSGKVSQKMVATWAQDYWAMQQQVKANPAITNTLSPDITQGTLPYLMGMSYYQRLSKFDDELQQLHKVHTGSVAAQGLSKLNAKRDTAGHLTSPLTLYHPNVDMAYLELTSFGNQTLRADEGASTVASKDSYERLTITEGSAQEHKVIEDFYGKSGGISSVRLLLESQQPGGSGMVELTSKTYGSYASLATYDANIWQSVVNAFTNAAQADPSFANVFITLKPVTNSAVAYTGMGALIYAPLYQAALISGNLMPQNGGWGLPLSAPIYNPPDFNDINLSFNTSFNNSWSVSYSLPTPSLPTFVDETIPSWDSSLTYNNISSGALNLTGDPVLQSQFYSAGFSLGLPSTGTALASTYQDIFNNGGDYVAQVGPELAQLSSPVLDPVNAVTGEFYVEATDLSLPGPMPMLIRRNYSSQNVDLGDSQFGYGWRPAYQPYLRMVTNNLIYACEMDGTVVAYRQPISGTNYWKPFPSDNPQLNNRSSAGIGSTASLFNNYITNTVVSGVTNFFLNGSDGSVRFFQYTNYPVAGSAGSFDRNRPYLKTWTDASGNSFSFTYQTDSTQPDYGQVRRIQSSNGNFLTFNFDVYAHITDAYTEDGRRLHYDYDDHGDLVTVTLPDESQINYVYQHTTVVTNSMTNIVSTHLILQEQKPDGRLLANTYDSLRRVTIQAATVGNDLNLVTNATFAYFNNFTNLTNSVLSGTNYIADVFGRTNTYIYTNNLITSIQDALGQTVIQVWFFNTNDPGYYPNSLKSLTDKRGLKTDYQYDALGNLAQTIMTGNLTGGSATNETATSTFAYNARNLVSTATDPLGNQTVYAYTNTACPFLPTATVKKAGGTPVATNQYFYTSVVQVVTNGAVFTNRSFGLLQRSIEGGFVTNDFGYDGRGFKTAQTNYTGTGDPAVITSFFYTDRGDLEQTTDAAGRGHLYAYDAMGRKTQDEVYEAGANTPEGFNYSYYNDNGEVVWTDGSRYNPEDYVWRDYDGAGRKITEMRWRSEAKADGSGVQAANDLYATTFYQYDAFGDLIQITDPQGNYTVQSFDAIGQLTKQVAFGTNGVPLATNTFGYEPGGQLAFATNALGAVTAKTYTSIGKPKSQSNPNGSTNAWRYDISGRSVTEVLANGNYWQSSYDDANLRVTKIFHNATTTLATNLVQFDTRGNLIQNTDFQGATSTNFFDGLNRIKVASGPPTVTVYTGGTSPLNATNQITNVVQQLTFYLYDASGQVLTVTNLLGEKTIITSDALQRTTQVAVYPSNSVTPIRVNSAFYSADSQSVTVTNGTGGTAIASTTYTDNDGHTVLTVGYPTTGTTEYLLQQYDRAGNHIAQQQCSFNGSTVTVYATNGWIYDGLNRLSTDVSKDGALTTYNYDALGNLLSRAMPGNLTWSATYFNDGRIATEQTANGALTARSLTYAYYAAGSPFAGMLQTISNGRGTTFTSSYDDFLRLATVNTSGGLVEQQTTTAYHYDPSGELTNLSQGFVVSTTGPPTTLTRSYDLSHRLASENVAIGGGSTLSTSQGWDIAGRRTSLQVGRMGEGFRYQADGLMTASGEATFGYGNNGLLIGRTNSSRSFVVNQRDGRGRMLQTTTKVLLSTALGETLNWRNDGRLTNYVASRGDFTDTRNYSYSALAQRLTQEGFNTASGQRLTNSYTIDRGVAGGLGVLTSSAQSGSGSGTWSVPVSGGLDGLSRVAAGQNTVISRPATGLALGAASVSALLDTNPVAVQFDGTEADGRWRANLDLSPGSHTLKITAVHPSGLYTAYATNVFTANGGAVDTVTNLYDGNGNITQRIWLTGGATNRMQTLTWDAFDRLIKVSDRDKLGSGFDHVSVYDGLGRRVRTVYTMVVSNSPIISPASAVSTVDSYYDPEVEFLEVGTSVNGALSLKTYGPDANGTYGGMNGVGGLEAVTQYGLNVSTGFIQDCLGNILATVKSGTITWSGTRVSSYGPVTGYQSPPLSPNVPLAQSLGWRGKRVDETGLVYLGARLYDPQAGRFLSADPLGHASSADLYSFAGGDPVNFFDASGRLNVAALNDAPSPIQEWYNSTVLAPLRQMQEDKAYNDQFAGVTEAREDFWKGTLNVVTFGLYNAGSEAFTSKDIYGQNISGAERGIAIAELGLLGLPVLGRAAALGGDLSEFLSSSASQLGDFLDANAPVFNPANYNYDPAKLYGGLPLPDYTAPSQSIPGNSTIGSTLGKLNQYPQILDPRTGSNIPFPSNVGQVVPQSQRVSWGAQERGSFIAEWYQKGFQTPTGGWENYDIHHIMPREFGGDNNFWNLVPVERNTHQDLFNSFWRDFTGL